MNRILNWRGEEDKGGVKEKSYAEVRESQNRITILGSTSSPNPLVCISLSASQLSWQGGRFWFSRVCSSSFHPLSPLAVIQLAHTLRFATGCLGQVGLKRGLKELQFNTSLFPEADSTANCTNSKVKTSSVTQTLFKAPIVYLSELILLNH